jgi:hypothetical protein
MDLAKTRGPYKMGMAARDNSVRLTHSTILTYAGARTFREATSASTATATASASLPVGHSMRVGRDPRLGIVVDRIIMYFDVGSITTTPRHATLRLPIGDLVAGDTGFYVVAPDSRHSFPTTPTTAEYSTFDARVSYQESGLPVRPSVVRGGSVQPIRLNAAARRQIREQETFILYLITRQELVGEPRSLTRTAGIKMFRGAFPTLDIITNDMVDQVRQTQGAPGRGFSSRNLIVTTGGKTVGNGFEDI